MESMTVSARSPASIMCVALTSSSTNERILCTVPTAAQCVNVTCIDGSLCKHWRVERTEGLWQHLSIAGLKKAQVTYFMTPVIDAGHLFLMIPAVDSSRISIDVSLSGTEFRTAAIECSLMKLSPIRNQVSPTCVVVAIFVVLLLVTVALAVLL